MLKVDLAELARTYHAGRGTSPAPGGGGVSPGSPDTDPGSGAVRTAGAGGEEALHTLKIVANLPYYITTPILMSLFRKKVPAQSITVMVQKEVADRMCAQPGGKDYGSLSVAVQYYSAPKIVELVPPSSFIPHPKVTSAVVTMELYEELPVQAQDEELFDAIVRAAFGQRRKTLVNALSSATPGPFGKEQIAGALGRLGFSPSIRGEKLTVRDFAALADLLGESAGRRN